MENQQPDKEPGDDDNLAGTLRAVFRKQMMAVDGQLPAEVVSYDREKNTATVRPLISLLTTGGAAVTRAPLASVPVLALGGGGFVVNFPLKAGDRGWIEASDRDISLFMQSGNGAQPNTMRLHNFSDGRFVPDVFSKYTIGGDDDAAMVIQSLDGSVCISVHEDKIKLKAPTVEVEAETQAKIKAPIITFEGVVNQTGGNYSIGGINFNTHRHTGVEPGAGTSGGPVA